MKLERGIWVYDEKTKKLIPKAEYRGLDNKPNLNIITDEIPPTESYATDERKIFTSKAKLRQHYRENGCIEVDKEDLKWKPKKIDRKQYEAELVEDIRQAYFDCKYNRVKLTEREKQKCLEELRMQQRYGR